MPTSERLRLIRLADRENKLIIEDDYDSEFGYFNRPTPSLQGLDCGRNVIYIGTFSKLLLPSIRLSFMILPDASGEYEKKAELYNQTASKTEQIALCELYPRRKSVNKNKKNQKTVYPKNEAADISPERGFRR